MESSNSNSEPTEDEISQSADATDTDALRRSLVASINEFEKSFRKNFPILWGASLVGPFLVTVAILVLMGMFGGWTLPGKYVTAALLTFFVFGRFVILGGTEGEVSGWAEHIALTPAELFLMVTYMDFAVAFFVTFHMGILFRVPWVGEKIAALVSDGRFVMEHHPWIKRIAFLGLVIFVVFPTSTTGSIGGSIFGRLLGLSRWLTVLGVLCGSLIGNGLMYIFAKEINRYIGPGNIWLKLAGVVILILACVFLEWRYRQAKKRHLGE